jgi:hypothetical protein
MDPLIAQELRRITGEGTSPPTSAISATSGGSSGSGLPNHSVNQLSTNIESMHSAASSRVASLHSNFDGVHGSAQVRPDASPMVPVLNMIGMHTQQVPETKGRKPVLYLQVPQGKRYPGYPTPVSPTTRAMQLYPSPATEASNSFTTPQAGSPMSIESPEIGGPWGYHESHGFEHNIDKFAPHSGCSNGGNTGSPQRSTTSTGQNIEYVNHAKVGGMSLAFPRRSPSPATTISPTSPPRVKSPRNAMLKSTFGS